MLVDDLWLELYIYPALFDCSAAFGTNHHDILLHWLWDQEFEAQTYVGCPPSSGVSPSQHWQWGKRLNPYHQFCRVPQSLMLILLLFSIYKNCWVRLINNTSVITMLWWMWFFFLMSELLLILGCSHLCKMGSHINHISKLIKDTQLYISAVGQLNDAKYDLSLCLKAVRLCVAKNRLQFITNLIEGFRAHWLSSLVLDGIAAERTGKQFGGPPGFMPPIQSAAIGRRAVVQLGVCVLFPQSDDSAHCLSCFG